MAHIEISKTSSAEFISHQLLKFVVNPNPMAALVNGFCDYLNLLQINNIIDVLNELKEKIDFVEEQIHGKLYVDPPVFKDDVLPTLQKAKDELNAEKRYLSIYILKQLDYYTPEKRLVEKIGQNYDNEVTLVHLWQLQPCGLVDKISAQEFESLYKSRGNIRMRHPEGVFLYKRTGLGNSFLNFFVNGMPEENSKYNDTK